jgi:type I restriction enzyme S subunit
MSDLTALDSLLDKLPSGWSSPIIASVARLINGRGFKPHEWETDGLPIIRIQNLNGSTDFNYYSGSYNPKIEVNTGDLLFAWSGSRGTSFGPHFWKGPKGVLNYHTWRVKVDESAIAPDFFYHALRFLTRIIEDRAHGASALVHVQKWEMEEFGFPCPNDRAEQQAIAAALSDADGVVAGLERVIAKKRLIKQGAMQDLLTARGRLPGFSGEWVQRKLGTVAMLQRGFDLPNSIRKDGVYPVVYSNGVMATHSAFMCEGPGVVTGRSGTIGNVTFVAGQYWPHNTALWVKNFFGNSPRFIYYLLEFIDLRRFASGSGVPTLNRNDAHDDIVSVPKDIDEQKAICGILDDMDAEIQTLESRLIKARAVKEGMMQNLLTGRVRLV